MNTIGRLFRGSVAALPLACAGLLLAAASARAQSVTDSPPAGAVSSRTELIARAQAEKATRLRPYELTAPERAIERVEHLFVGPSTGFFPLAGSIHAGGGLAFGGGYRHWYRDEASVKLSALYSIRSYKLIEVSTASRGHAGGRLDLELHGGWRDATQVAYYGLGMTSTLADRANYRFRQTFAGGRATLRPIPRIVLGGGLAYEDFRPGPGRGRAPSIEARFTPLEVPGLDLSPAFLHSDVSAGIDWRPSPGYARRGGAYGLTLHDYRNRRHHLSFRRLDAEAVQHVPVARETWVLSLRGRVQTTMDDEAVVPYFLLPSLGGGSTLRGYSSWRFHDRHSMLGSAEWRWMPSRLALDVALFYDIGKVSPRRADLGFRDLKSSTGVGFRFHTPAETVLRFDLARGSEGWYLAVGSGASF